MNQENGEKAKDESSDMEEMSMESLLEESNQFLKKLYEREIVKVKVVGIVEDKILVDIKEKREAIIPLNDFQNGKKPQVGEEIDAILVKKGNERAYTFLSHREAKEKIAMEACRKIFESRQRTRGRITEIVKGGYIVDIMGIGAFMPLSLSEIGGAHKHYLPKNARVKVYITDFVWRDKKIIVSRRHVLEEDEKERKKKVFSKIKPGMIVRTVVSKRTKDGLFIRYQGIEGFMRKEDVSWRGQEEEIKKYERGQRVKCKILSVDSEKERLNFGIKQLTPNPVDLLRRKYLKKTVKGIVETVNEKGAKVRINEKTMGFVPASDFSDDGKPKEKSEIKAMVFGVDTETYELNLSIKKYENFEEKKRIQKYLKSSPNLTLGQILGNIQNAEE